MKRVLVAGLPRSGTTWVALILARAAEAVYLEEPDNHFRWAYAFRAKQTLGRREYPLLRPGESVDGAMELATLWHQAFTPSSVPKGLVLRRHLANRLVRITGARRVSAALAGSRRASGRLGLAAALGVPEQPREGARSLVVKSVYAPLCVEWIAFGRDVQVVIVVRNPLNVVSSWIQLGWLDRPASEMLSTLDPEIADELAANYETSYPEAASPLERAAWLAGILTCALADVARRNPGWPCVVHEELSIDPSDGFATLAANAGLPWTQEADRMIRSMDRPGRGYETARVAAELPAAWRARLDADQVRAVRGVLDRLPLPSW